MEKDEIPETWQKVRKNRYERASGIMERLVWLIGASQSAYGHDEWHLSISAKIKPHGEAFVDVLRNAWMHLRFDHPSIAARIGGDMASTVSYEPPVEPTDLTTWLHDTFKVHDEEVELEGLIKSVQPAELLRCHFLPFTGELLLETSHWRTDGRGIVMLLNRLLELTALNHDATSLPWGDEVSRLIPSQEEATSVPDTVSEEDFRFIERKVADALKTTPILTIPNLGDDNVPQLPQRTVITLSEADTASIVRTCKKKEISVTTFVHAALARTNILHATDGTAHHPYRTTFRVDCRQLLPQRYTGARFASGICHFAIPTDVAPYSDFDSCLTQLNVVYKGGVDSRLQRIRGRYFEHLMSKFLSPESRTQFRASDVDMSSLGVLDPILAPKFSYRSKGEYEALVEAEVTEVAVSPAQYSSMGGFLVWTFRGRMNLCVTWNDAYHTKAQMDGILDTVKDEMLKHLEN